MKQTEKHALALQLLKELNAPDDILLAVEMFGMFVHNDEVKLHNWEALSDGGVIEGEAKEVEFPPEC